VSATASSGLKLHVGCGSTVVAGWENLDKSPSVTLARFPGLRRALAAARVLTAAQANAVFPPGIVRADVRCGLPYPDSAARCVYSSHMIEHMARWQGLDLVRECARVLEPGGILRFATPDLARLIGDYERAPDDDGAAADALMSSLGTFSERPGSRIATVLQRLFTAPHQWLYDEASLTLLLHEGGFIDVRTRAFRESDLPDIELLEHREGSLFVEARRP
jgi:predicted SAM-dependent methyltransferase